MHIVKAKNPVFMANKKRNKSAGKKNPTVTAKANGKKRRGRKRGRRNGISLRNPSMADLGGSVKIALYGGGGIVLTNVFVGAAEMLPFIGDFISSNKFIRPIAKGLVAVIPVYWVVKMLRNPADAKLAAGGGLVIAGLDFINALLPTAEATISNFVRAPFQLVQNIGQQPALASGNGANGSMPVAARNDAGAMGDVMRQNRSVMGDSMKYPRVATGIRTF